MEIHTLVKDVYALMERKDGWFTKELADGLSESISLRLSTHFNPEPRTPTLRLSRMGPRCPRALWYSIHHPELSEATPPWVYLKYSFGHILEAQTIALAKAAGHSVTGEQDECTLDGIKGHCDCIIDGCVCDVKSASTRSFQKFKNGSLAHDDPFGYLEQLDGYVVALSDDSRVTVKDRGYLLAIDKTLGHMVLYEHRVRPEHIRSRIASYKSIVASTTPPACECGQVEQGKSGNIGLDVRASYSAFKYCCFPRLRAFRYADGPVYLTKVVRVPDVPEIFRKVSSFSKEQPFVSGDQNS